MFGRRANLGMGHSGRVWPVMAVLVAMVLLPSALMLGFMDAAMRNEALAVRQRLAKAYGSEAAKAVDRLDRYWAAQAAKLASPAGLPAPQAFQRLLAAGLADGVVLLDESGAVAYPTPQAAPAPRPASASLLAAATLEEDGQAAQASDAYAAVAARSSQADLSAQALLGQARCLAKAGRKDQAIEVLVALTGAVELADARDDQGRLIVPAAALFALQIMGDSHSPAFRAMADRLAGWLNDYAAVTMPSSQRRFLMASLREVDPSAPALPTLEAEDLAAEVLGRGPMKTAPARLVPSALAGVYLLAGDDGRVIALMRQERVLADTNHAFDPEPLAGMRLDVFPPGARGARASRSSCCRRGKPCPAGRSGWT